MSEYDILQNRITRASWKKELLYVVRILNAIMASGHDIAVPTREVLTEICREDITEEGRDAAIARLKEFLTQTKILD